MARVVLLALPPVEAMDLLETERLLAREVALPAAVSQLQVSLAMVQQVAKDLPRRKTVALQNLLPAVAEALELPAVVVVLVLHMATEVVVVLGLPLQQQALVETGRFLAEVVVVAAAARTVLTQELAVSAALVMFASGAGNHDYSIRNPQRRRCLH